MSFENLPTDWPTRPVTDPTITADLLDLIVGDRDRHNGAIGILLCGASGRLFQPVVVSAPEAEVREGDRQQVFDVMGQAMGRLETGRPGMLVAVARPGSPHVGREDLQWRDAAARSCADYEVDLLGVWLMTPTSIRPMPAHGSRRRSA